MYKLLIILSLTLIINASDDANNSSVTNYIKGLKYYNLYVNDEQRNIETLDKSIKYFEESCYANNTASCNHGGFLNNMLKNSIKAKKLYRISCKNDDQIGCFRLANIYNSEIYKNDNPEFRNEYKFIDSNKVQYKYDPKAIMLYKKACSLKLGKSCNKLAHHYFLLSEKNKTHKKESNYFLRKACVLGDDSGCIDLAEFYVFEKENIKLAKDIYMMYCHKEKFTNRNSCLILEIYFSKHKSILSDK